MCPRGQANVVTMMGSIQGATALKGELGVVEEDMLDTMFEQAAEEATARLETKSTSTVRSKEDQRKEAKLRGYEGDSCSECFNFTLVRNGTCMKCDTCGSTTGCS